MRFGGLQSIPAARSSPVLLPVLGRRCTVLGVCHTLCIAARKFIYEGRDGSRHCCTIMLLPLLLSILGVFFFTATRRVESEIVIVRFGGLQSMRAARSSPVLLPVLGRRCTVLGVCHTLCIAARKFSHEGRYGSRNCCMIMLLPLLLSILGVFFLAATPRVASEISHRSIRRPPVYTCCSFLPRLTTGTR